MDVLHIWRRFQRSAALGDLSLLPQLVAGETDVSPAAPLSVQTVRAAAGSDALPSGPEDPVMQRGAE